jgi:hypothetical protein
MHAFITLHKYYRGSPPPGLRPQRFGSWLFYYGSFASTTPRTYNSPQMGKISTRRTRSHQAPQPAI